MASDSNRRLAPPQGHLPWRHSLHPRKRLGLQHLPSGLDAVFQATQDHEVVLPRLVLDAEDGVTGQAMPLDRMPLEQVVI